METGKRHRGVPHVAAAVLVAAMVATWFVAASEVLDLDEKLRLACWITPNGSVPLLASFAPDCPLQAYDRIDVVRDRQGKRYVRR